MITTLAVDVGYGYVKATAPHGATARFAAVFAPEPADATWDQTFGAGGLDRVLWQPEGATPQLFWIGEAARRRPGAQRPWAQAATERVGYTLLVDAALAALAPPGALNLTVDLVVGLPLGLFGSQKAALQQALLGHAATIRRGREGPVAVRIAQVTVLPQAAGAYYAAALAPDADPALTREPAGVIDVGYRTTDYFVMEPDGQGGVRPVRTLSGSLDLGLVTVTEAVRQRLEARTGQLLDPLRVEAALAQDPPALRQHGEVWPLGELRAEAAGLVARQVTDALRGVWGALAGELGTVLVAGGGALWLGPALTAAWPQARVLADPIGANARGFLLARQLATGQLRAAEGSR